MISRVIEWCARNRFLVFAGVLFLLLAGIWSLQRIPLDALPDISDVQVIVHTPWPGRPPNVIEDQVTYPIVTTLLAAPHVKAVRAQTMFGDSYVFVVFHDGTDLYWARSRVLEYIQQLGGRLPQGAQPMIGPDATGVGWVFEYVLLRDLGTVTFGPDIREGVAEWQGEGEAVGGIIVMRTGENALNVINGVKARVAEIAPSLPAGVEIHAGYDRSGLISESIRTLQRDLLAECVIVSFVTIIFLFHFRSALIPILTLPVALLAAFIPMYFLHISSNIMSLGGFALAIGVLIDASIVIVENGYRHLSEAGQVNEKQRRRILIDAAKQVGPALFFSLLVIVVSFLPVFLLEAQEGRMFRPLAWTKTLSVAFSSLLAVTVVPALDRKSTRLNSSH